MKSGLDFNFIRKKNPERCKLRCGLKGKILAFFFPGMLLEGARMVVAGRNVYEKGLQELERNASHSEL